MSRRVVFLDRDGTINVDHGYVSTIERWEFVDGAIQGMKLLQDNGFALAVVTNQSGVAAGRCTEQDVERLHQFMCEQLAQAGVTVDAIAYCPHSADAGCRCRKPQTGMAEAIRNSLQESVDYDSSWMIGDKIADVEFGRGIGVQTALLRSPYWMADDLESISPHFISNRLLDVATMIIAE
ncbi:MAG: HAD family hydrolase [Pirellulaceae bacterium]|jgi:D-glycero-D-manno-heptose 1,7-bisphosphate phosphatase|nr:HAD family hydrolase [Pirellulaceae bacterium]